MFVFAVSRQEFIHEKLEEMIVVETVTPGSPAALADIRKVPISPLFHFSFMQLSQTGVQKLECCQNKLFLQH